MSARDKHILGDVISELVGAGLLQPRPVMMSFRAWSMLLPSVAQAIGLCCFGVVAWSFTEMGNLGTDYRINLVVIGSFLIASGGSIGSLPVTVELFRKRRNGGWAWFDWATAIFSPIASLVETVIALSFLGGFEISENLPRIIGLAVLGTLDTVLGMAELGDYLGSYDQRLQQWKRDYKSAVKSYTTQQPSPPQQYQQPTGEFAQTKPLPDPQQNGNGGYCFCGEHCNSPQQYAAHVRYTHYQETEFDPDTGQPYLSAAAAWDAMKIRYASTIPAARWPFPDLDRVVKMRKET